MLALTLASAITGFAAPSRSALASSPGNLVAGTVHAYAVRPCREGRCGHADVHMVESWYDAGARLGSSAVGAAAESATVAAAPTPAIVSDFVPGETCTGEKVVVVGATGYIGKAVVREAVRRGYPTTAVVRDAATAAAEPKFQGASVVQADVSEPSQLASGPFAKGEVDVVISCLASRSGSKKDSFKIDYQATLNCLEAARAAGARHFVMLSAFCVKSAERNDKYALQFQYAKKDMEAALRAQDDVSYTIVRPTAFFKSVSGQVEVVNGGAPFVYFDLGGGKCATCNPISEPDLAAALVDTIADPSKKDALWNLGGPDDGLSMREQGELVADVLGKEEAKMLGVPIGIFEPIINTLQWLGDTFKSEKLIDAAEFGRIGRYYAVVDMLTDDPADKYGKTTLRAHYERIAVEGQEYDPYTSVFGGKQKTEDYVGKK